MSNQDNPLVALMGLMARGFVPMLKDLVARLESLSGDQTNLVAYVKWQAEKQDGHETEIADLKAEVAELKLALAGMTESVNELTELVASQLAS